MNVNFPRFRGQPDKRALNMAVQKRNPKKGLIHHSDRGSQYASLDYRKVLEKYGMVCSMSRKGNCYDKSVMESFPYTES